MLYKSLRAAAVAAVLTVAGVGGAAGNDADTIWNVSYDISRELYAAITPAFQAPLHARS